jgi:hypothetical protein
MKIATAICRLCCKWQFDQNIDKNKNAANTFVICKKCKNQNYSHGTQRVEIM